MDDAELLREAAAALDVALDDAQIAQFLRFRDLLLDWNTRMNLTTITEPRAVITRHFVDALTCLVGVDAAVRSQTVRVLDVGSGAGLPGLALAIALPHWRVVSLESTGKKVLFQEAVITALALPNATAVQERAETLAHARGWRDSFAVVTARAVAALPTLLEWCQPFAQVGGVVLAAKKGDLQTELQQGANAATILGGGAPEVLALPASLTALVPDLADGRVIIRVRQHFACHIQYPRAGSAPMKAPLGA